MLVRSEKIWLEYITYSLSSVLTRVFHAFWQDEYQDKYGNLPHIHGLCALYKEDRDDPLFKDVIMDLQKCSVLDLCLADEGKS